MTEKEFLDALSSAIERLPWHWYRYHADAWRVGRVESLFGALASVAVRTDVVICGFAQRLIVALSSSSGRVRDVRDYEQLMQAISEATVVSQIALCNSWPAGTTLELEPTAQGSKKNPEVVVRAPGLPTIGIEVKAPGLTEHRKRRATRRTQATYRGNQPLDPDATPPRDNPIKDFLVSAEAKFAAFRAHDEHFIGVLVVVWDDHVYEPITALLHPLSGLLTDKSFYRGEDGRPVTFPSVTAVVLLCHLHQIVAAAAGRPQFDGIEHGLDYGRPGFPFKVAVPDGIVEHLPRPLVDCFQLVDRHPTLGAEYDAQDIVWWLGGNEATSAGPSGADGTG